MRSSTAKKTRAKRFTKLSPPKSGWYMESVPRSDLTDALDRITPRPRVLMLHVHLLNRALYNRKTGMVVQMIDIVYFQG